MRLLKRLGAFFVGFGAVIIIALSIVYGLKYFGLSLLWVLETILGRKFEGTPNDSENAIAGIALVIVLAFILLVFSLFFKFMANIGEVILKEIKTEVDEGKNKKDAKVFWLKRKEKI
jgi:Na+-transporting methylmalonyl-CoA/oxaloacetate decarboxylase gamma subunit